MYKRQVVESVAAWAYEAGVPVMLNPAPAAALSDTLLGHVTYLSPNEHEATLMSGQQIAVGNGINREDMHRAARYFMQRGVKNLIVTLGANGSVCVNQNGTVYTPSVHMDKIIDTTAAGDSFVAAFCTGLTAGLDERQALAFASHTAAITVSRMGAMPSLPTITEVKALSLIHISWYPYPYPGERQGALDTDSVRTAERRGVHRSAAPDGA